MARSTLERATSTSLAVAFTSSSAERTCWSILPRRSASWALTASRLRLGGIGVAAQFGLAEERKAERALGGEVAVRARAAHLADAVVAAKAEAGQPLAAIGRMDGLDLDDLILQGLVVLAIFVGDGAEFFRGLRGQIAVGRRIGEHDLLAGIDADLALEQDEVFFEAFSAAMSACCCGLKLNSRAQFVEIGCDTGLVSFMGVIERAAGPAASCALALSTSLEAAMACR